MTQPIHRWAGLAVLALGSCGGALAQKPKPPEMSPSVAAMHRFPQPVQTADLIGRAVLEPTESKSVLGHVEQLVRSTGGEVQVVVAYGGLFGIGARPIAVPLYAMALLGKDLEILDFTPGQLRTFPAFDGLGTTPLAPGDTIRIGLARPSH